MEASSCAKVRSWHLPSCPSALRPAPSFGKRTGFFGRRVGEMGGFCSHVAMVERRMVVV